jgi:ribosomal protein S12 methylthiotransferase accessory factor
MDEYRKDFRDVHDLMCQQQFFLDPRAIEYVKEWIETAETIDYSQLPTLPERSLSCYQKVVEEKGYEVFFADITTSDGV